MAENRTVSTLVKSRPILFSAPMVRALLSGAKTQTRRVVKPMPGRQSEWLTAAYLDIVPSGRIAEVDGEAGWAMQHPRGGPGGWVRCPYGKPGDTLWVRETWQAWNCTNVEYDEWEAITTERRHGVDLAEWVATNGKPDSIEYRATSDSTGPWTPSIHMPRWASRLTLEVTGVRVERLQSITEEDAKAEGVEPTGERWRDYLSDDVTPPVSFSRASNSFWSLWGAINGADSWAANPWVWVLSFKVVTP